MIPQAGAVDKGKDDVVQRLFVALVMRRQGTRRNHSIYSIVSEATLIR